MIPNATPAISKLQVLLYLNQVMNGLDLFLAAAFIDIIALGMTAIMIYNIKSKYTAVGTFEALIFVGRKEIVLFFYLYFIDAALDFMLVSNIISFSSPLYQVPLSVLKY